MCGERERESLFLCALGLGMAVVYVWVVDCVLDHSKYLSKERPFKVQANIPVSLYRKQKEQARNRTREQTGNSLFPVLPGTRR